MVRTPEAIRRLLESAGYAWNQEREAWVHPRTGRTLSGRASRVFTPDEIAIWIKADGAAG
jgi:hypothetical protein